MGYNHISSLYTHLTPHLKIQPVNKGRNRYCGPAAVSIVTGLSTGDVARVMRQLSGKKMITGVNPVLLQKTFNHLGYSLDPFLPVTSKLTLRRWIFETQQNLKFTPLFVVAITNHYCVVQEDQCCCSQIRVPVKIDEYKNRRRRVKQSWIVQKIRDVDLSPFCLERKYK